MTLKEKRDLERKHVDILEFPEVHTLTTGASLPAMACVMARLVPGYSITNYYGEKGLITIELIE